MTVDIPLVLAVQGTHYKCLYSVVLYRTTCWCEWWTDAPIIDCESAAAYVDDFGVFLRCEVRARPPLTSIYWLIDVNNTVVMDGESVGDYWSIDLVRATLQPRLPAELQWYKLCTSQYLQLQAKTCLLHKSFHRRLFAPIWLISRLCDYFTV